MAKKKISLNREKKNADSGLDRTEKNNITAFLSGKNAKWLFFGIYFIVTVFLFRDFLFSDDMLFGNDTIPDGIYTRSYYKDYHAEYGGIPRWNPFILGGLPFIDAMHGDTFYPGAWLKFFMPLKRALGHKLVWHVFLAGIFMYIYLRTLDLRREASFLGGLMYMLAPSFVTLVYPAHDAKMYIIALLPLAFALLEKGMKKPGFSLFAALGGVMGLLILTSHVQMAYYSFWAIGIYFIFRLFTAVERNKSEFLKRIGLFAFTVYLALTVGAVQLLPSYKFTTSQSVRAGEERTSYEYATSWSMHPEETMGMLVPSFSGFINGRQASNMNLYWGKNWFKLNTEYHGILPLLFAVLALIACRTRLKWYFLGIALLSLIYALGANTPFYRLFYAFVPGVKNFRAPSMIIFLFSFAVSVMASIFISSLLDGKTTLKKRDSRLLYAVVACFLVTVLISFMGKSFFNLWQGVFYRGIPQENMEKMIANISYFNWDLWRICLLVGVSLMGVWMFLSRKIGVLALVSLLTLVVFIDDTIVDSRFITVFNPARNPGTAPDSSVKEIQEIMKESQPFRILGGILSKAHPANYYAMFGIQTADGSHNNELQTYELFKGGREYYNFLLHWIDNNGSIDIEGFEKNNFLKVAGVKYIVFDKDDGTGIFETPASLDRAFIVHEFEMVKNDTLAVEMLKDSAFDPSKTVIIDDMFKMDFPTGGDIPGRSFVKSLKYTKDGAVVNAYFHTAGFLVLTDNWVPYWQASVDGDLVNVHRAYGTFMAVECLEGDHEIIFTYNSPPYKAGKILTLSSMIFIFFSLVVSGVSRLIKRKKIKS